MTRAPPLAAASGGAGEPSFLPASSPLPLSPPEPPQNPWRINHPATAAGAAATALPLMGEPPSSWPALSPSSQVSPSSLTSSPDPPPPPPRRSVSPPPTSPANAAADLVPPSSDDNPDPALTSPPPPAPLPSPANATPPADHRPPPPRPSAPRRGGRNQRFYNNRGGGGGGGGGGPRGNSSYTHHRPPVMRPNSSWSGFGSAVPQAPLPWGGYFPGSPVGVVPPGDMTLTPPAAQYFMQFPQAYGELMYPTEYVAEPYYYEQHGYEVPFGLPMSPGVTAVITPSQPVQSFPVEVGRDHDEVNVLKSELLSQIEYYFSDENLVRDTYLRRKMDSQGWVDVHVIAAFKRVESLTEDMGLIKDTLQSSNVVEIQGNKIRKRQEWHKWILQQSSSPSTLVTSIQNMRLGD